MKSIFLTTVRKVLQAQSMPEQSIWNIPTTFLTSLFCGHQIHFCDHDTFFLSERRTDGTGSKRLSLPHIEKIWRGMLIVARYSLVISKTGKLISGDNSTNQTRSVAGPANFWKGMFGIRVDECTNPENVSLAKFIAKGAAYA